MIIILDRDGVINEDSDAYIKSPQEWHPIPGSLEAIAALCKSGHTIVVATNQSGVGRGLYSLETLEHIHQKMRQAVIKLGGRIDRIYYCPHHPDEECGCRKPKSGMIRAILADYQVTGQSCIVVGDSLRDLQAGAAVGCQLALVKTGKGQQTLTESYDFSQVMICDNLLDFLNNIRTESASDRVI